MLVELAVRDLGVIAELRIPFGPGMSALTGETGAGKTMIIEALSLLLGGKADPTRVRSGASEAVIEGYFTLPIETGDQGEAEYVLRRVVPVEGRSRSYINGGLTTAAGLGELGSSLVEICGQHAYQRLQSPPAQRRALDRFAKIDTTAFKEALKLRRSLVAELEGLGGDERLRAREIDLLRYQLAELAAAALTDPAEDEVLSVAEDRLAQSDSAVENGRIAYAVINEERGATDQLATALSHIERIPHFADQSIRLQSTIAELSDLAHDLRAVVEGVEADPLELERLRNRRQLLSELRRKYGETLEEVMAYEVAMAQRLSDLEAHEERAALLEANIGEADAEIARLGADIAVQRKEAAPRFAAAITAQLGEVAMKSARIDCAVSGDGPADEVEFLLAANPGLNPAPLSKAASGGELSRAMLALHLVTSEGAPTMIFDEVDAGLGGAAAVEVGRALAGLADHSQVLVVTHLPQVAAHADHQLVVSKSGSDLAISTVVAVKDQERIIELSRMLSGSPDSERARSHAEELLAEARSRQVKV
ncbi:MAG TPA: DNA repair protein RecN [Acidimicrobiaceae bacterium]|nr:DNA repair protein RecN [Acidimicrobiaceae bacterium]